AVSIGAVIVYARLQRRFPLLPALVPAPGPDVAAPARPVGWGLTAGTLNEEV
ncbi:unnamed protein product, partial [marine sediment metagenome]